jgi:ATP adenylyltransferase
MDYVFTPWRYAYVSTADRTPGCVFCQALGGQNGPAAAGVAPETAAKSPLAQSDAKNKIVHRGQHCFVILNAFPYNSGHVMVVPYEHLDQLNKLSVPAAQEMMDLAQRLEGIMRELYHPDGLNLGMNIGKAAGAGVAGHIHMHVLPRWVADANFMSVVSETRVLPEDLETTYQRIKARF